MVHVLVGKTEVNYTRPATPPARAGVKQRAAGVFERDKTAESELLNMTLTLVFELVEEAVVTFVV